VGLAAPAHAGGLTVRILTIGNMYPPHHQGGYEQDWAAGVRALRAAGHEVSVLVSDHREPGVTEPDEPVVHRELRWYWHDHEFPRRSPREALAIERHNAAVLRRHLAGVDLVSWWPMGGMSIGLVEQVRRAGVPAIGVVYDDWMVYGPQVDAWQSDWGHRRILGPIAARVTRLPTHVRLSAAARWLFASESVRGAATRVRDLRDTELLPPGLDELFLQAAAPRPDWGWQLLAPGRLDPRKGLVTAVEALAQLPQARLRVIGGGDQRHADELRKRARDLGVAERFAIEPPRPRAELAAAYAEANTVLFPVLWAEPFGLVPLEAMGIGRPVVASGTGGSGEYLRDGENCLLHEPGDPLSLAAAVQRLADDATLRERLRQGGFTTAPPFARSRWDERLVAEHDSAGRVAR
jgi:glycogen(starch) synthase